MENPNWFFFLSILVDCNAVLKALQPIFQEQGMTETVHNWEDHGYLATYIKKNGRWVDFLLFLRDYDPSVLLYKYFSHFFGSPSGVQAGQIILLTALCMRCLKQNRIMLITLSVSCCGLGIWTVELINLGCVDVVTLHGVLVLGSVLPDAELLKWVKCISNSSNSWICLNMFKYNLSMWMMKTVLHVLLNTVIHFKFSSSYWSN